MSTACHSDDRSKFDDEGNPYYLYEDAPVETPFNIKVREDCTSRQIRTKEGHYYEFVDRKENYDSAASSTGIPQAYRYAKTKDFDYERYSNLSIAQEARQKGINFIKHFEKFKYKGVGLYIYSPSTGAGKTLLACIIANGLIRQYSEQPRFIEATSIFNESRKASRYSDNGDTSSEDKIRNIEKASVLIIDDLGAEKVTDFTNSILYGLISKRTYLGKVTIITSRKTLDELKYNASTINQIRSSTRVIELPNENVGAKVADEANKDLDDLLSQL